MLAAALLASATLIGSAYAHGAVTSYTIGGKDYEGWRGFEPNTGRQVIQRPWPNYDPIMSSTSAAMRCNGGTTAALSAEVAAGGEVTAHWKQWTHAEGPVTVYMAKCPGKCSGWAGDGNVWFKIDEAGLMSGTVNQGQWGNTVVLKTNKWTSKIPADLAPGEYLIRHELLALHQANTPQFYPECAQLIVTGSGTAEPSSGYKIPIPGAFPMSDPGIRVDIYSSTSSTYKVHGPPVWTGGNAPALTGTFAPAEPAAPAAPATPAPAGPAVPLWGQCGGTGYTGPTTCAQGTCTANGSHYSQCTP